MYSVTKEKTLPLITTLIKDGGFQKKYIVYWLALMPDVSLILRPSQTWGKLHTHTHPPPTVNWLKMCFEL